MPDLWAQGHHAPIISAAARNNVPAVYNFNGANSSLDSAARRHGNSRRARSGQQYQ